MQTKIIETDYRYASRAYGPIKSEYSDNGRILCKMTHYRAGGGLENPSIALSGVIDMMPTSLRIAEDNDTVMTFCGLIKKPVLAHYMFTALFTDVGQVVLRAGTKIKRSVRRGIIPCFETENYLFIAQNKNKQSAPARRAREGHNIMWIIKKSTDSYVGVVEDGVLRPAIKP